jgi:hypothetical protein
VVESACSCWYYRIASVITAQRLKGAVLDQPAKPASWADQVSSVEQWYLQLKDQLIAGKHGPRLASVQQHRLDYQQGQANEAVELAQLTHNEYRRSTDQVSAQQDLEDSLAYAQLRLRQLEAACGQILGVTS